MAVGDAPLQHVAVVGKRVGPRHADRVEARVARKRLDPPRQVTVTCHCHPSAPPILPLGCASPHWGMQPTSNCGSYENTPIFITRG